MDSRIREALEFAKKELEAYCEQSTGELYNSPLINDAIALLTTEPDTALLTEVLSAHLCCEQPPVVGLMNGIISIVCPKCGRACQSKDLAKALISWNRGILEHPTPVAEPEPCGKQSLLFIDATPNDGYVTRILSAYIDDSYYSDNTIGLPPENPLVKQMNEWREQRNALLRAAISKLNTSQVADKRADELWAKVLFWKRWVYQLCERIEENWPIIGDASRDAARAREALYATELHPSTKESQDA